MRRAVAAILGLSVGYGAGLVIGMGLVEAFSANTHDKSLEAAMTGAFVAGPVAALVGLVIGIVRGGRQ